MSPERVLVCAPLMPEYDRESGSRRIFDLIAFLRESDCAVSFVARNALDGERYAHMLRQLGVAMYSGFNSQTDELFASGRFDLAIFAFWYIAELHLPFIRRASSNTRIIIDSIDLHFVRNARRVFHKTAENGACGLLDSNYASEMIRELNTYAAADGVLTVSQKEADLINDLLSDPTLAHGVPDTEDLSFSTVPFAERKGILFIGNFRHAPNIEAVGYLCKDILPRIDPAIVAEHPVRIVGNAIDDTVRNYARDLPHVEMVGWVPSVLPYLQRARVAVIPLLYGAGTKRKLIQALMVGTPTVSTSIGTEGLNLQDGEHVLVADDPAVFANSIVRLLQDAKLWQRLVRRGRAQIMLSHSRQVARARFKQVISAVLAKKAKTAKLAVSILDSHHHRIHEHYDQLTERIREVVCSSLPSDAKVIVVSKGDDDLVRLDGRQGWHFPQTERGIYAGYYPASSAEAIAHLESLRAKGGEFLLFPSTALWWLEYYHDFKQYLDNHYQMVVSEENTCLIFALRDQVSGV